MISRQASTIHHSMSAGKITPWKGFDAKDYKSLSKVGICLDEARTGKLYTHSMDSVQPTITTGSVATPVQFLQNWLPGFVFVITAARNIDDLIGLSTVGAWEDEQVVQGVLERVGAPQPYGDYAATPKSSWNVNFVYRTVVRFEEGMQVGALEAARSARMQVDDSGMKREAAGLVLEIIRNSIGFYGYNSGNNLTFGFLNDPNLSSYVTVAAGAAGPTTWVSKTYLEIVRDIQTAIVALRTNSQDVIDPKKLTLTLGVATDCVDWLSKSTDFGYTVQKWLNDNYPNIRVVSAPQLNNANAGANVFYLFADSVPDMSTDGGKTWIQPVPTKFFVLGVQQLAKSYIESYANATAGVMLKRPYAVVRFTGI